MQQNCKSYEPTKGGGPIGREKVIEREKRKEKREKRKRVNMRVARRNVSMFRKY
jgi:hypothetical protein